MEHTCPRQFGNAGFSSDCTWEECPLCPTLPALSWPHAGVDSLVQEETDPAQRPPAEQSWGFLSLSRLFSRRWVR